MTIRKYQSRSQKTTLASPLSAGATAMTVNSGSLLAVSSIPAGQTFTVVIDPDTSLEEIVDVTNWSSGNTLTITRGVDGSSDVGHSAGAVVRHMAIGRDYRESNDHIENTTAAHGLTIANVLETTDTNMITTAMLQTNAVTTAKITDANVTTAKLVDGAVTSAKIADLSIATGDIADSAITTGKIANAAVTTAKIEELSVTTTKVADSAIVADKIALNSVTTAKILDANVTTAKIADSAIATAKIADGSITSVKILDGTIATEDLANGAVTSSKIADGTIVNADISASAAIAKSKLDLGGTITSADLVDGTIVNADINDLAAIAASKINGTAVTQADTGTVTSTMIADGTIVNADINASAAIALSKLATDPLARANHTGTQTASTISNFDTQVRTNRLDQMAAPTSAVSANSQKITNLGLATSNGDAVSVTFLESQYGIANGIAPLDTNGKVPFNHIPATAIAEVFVVSSQAAMLAISGAGVGDIAIRSDLNKSYILRVTPGTTLSNWNELLTPIDSVLSVDGATGAVDLTGVYLNKTTGVLAGNLNANTHKVTNLGTPTSNADAATKAYADTKLPLAGGTMSGAIAMGTNKITGLGTPTTTGDAATKEYVDVVAGSATAAAASAAAAAATYDNFDDRYLGAKSVAPTLDNDGNALITGAMYWSTVSNAMYIWDGSAWDTISSTAEIYRFRFTALGGETSKSGIDDAGLTLSYLVGKEQVYLNGILLARTSDYNATNGISITGLAALTAGDILEVITFTPFDVANTLSNTLFDAKGDILVATSADTPGKLTAGTNGQYLQADSSTATGLKWSSVSGYSAPTIGTTSIPSGSTVSTLDNLTINQLSLQEPVAPTPTFVAVCLYGNKTGYSNDGVLWAQGTLPSSASWNRLAYGNSTFIALQSNSNTSAVSTDGLSWTGVNMGNPTGYKDIAYGAGTFVAVGNDGVDNVATSTNGLSWTIRTNPQPGDYVAYGAGTFVSISAFYTTGSVSTNGTTWSNITIPINGYIKDLVYGDKFVAIVRGSATGMTSTNGSTWSTMTMPSAANWTSIAWGNNTYVAIAENSSTVAYSSDGISWTAGTLPSVQAWGGVTYGNGRFAAVSDAASTPTNAFAYSADGIAWTATDGPVNAFETYAAVQYGTTNIATAGNLTINGSAGTPGQVVQAYGGGVRWNTPAPAYLTPYIGVTAINSGAVTSTLQQFTANQMTLTGSLTAGGTNGTNGQVLTSNGATTSWTSPATSTLYYSQAITGVTSLNIPVATNTKNQLVINITVRTGINSGAIGSMTFNNNTGAVYYVNTLAQTSLNLQTCNVFSTNNFVINTPNKTTVGKGVNQMSTRSTASLIYSNFFDSSAVISSIQLAGMNSGLTYIIDVYGM